MATDILAVADTAGQSSTVTLASGATAILAMTSPASNAAVLWVELQVDAANGASPPAEEWVAVGRLTPGLGSAALAVIGPGSYRLNRPAGVACGGSQA